ncbi:MAG: tryptophan--tRNA ligase [archaeon]
MFAHRDFGRIMSAIQNKKKFVMMTGLMPSGKFHLGHMLLAQQMIFYQNLGAKLYVAVADLEAYNARQQSLAELRKVAIDQYLLNYIALGMSPKNCDFYFQSDRNKDSKKSNAYYRLASTFSRHATFNEFKAVYGEISPGKMNASLLQSADMFHPQLPEFEGQVPVLVPVGIDQDPHLRIARDIGSRYKEHNFTQLSSTYHSFLPGLKGSGKMSSSDELSYIAMTDSPKEVEDKVKKYALTGGRDTVEEQKKLGGDPEKCTVYKYQYYFFEQNDKDLKDRCERCKAGKLMCGECKGDLITNINNFLKKHQEKREKAKDKAEKFLS